MERGTIFTSSLFLAEQSRLQTWLKKLRLAHQNGSRRKAVNLETFIGRKATARFQSDNRVWPRSNAIFAVRNNIIVASHSKMNIATFSNATRSNSTSATCGTDSIPRLQRLAGVSAREPGPLAQAITSRAFGASAL